MDIGSAMNAMRDVAGLPAHPIIFQILMIFTWIFHIAFVHIALGAAGVAIYGYHNRHKNPHWERLSLAMIKVAKVSVSLLIVLGVAPLLFTQVIYDPQWYASNVLSAAWAIGFIFTLIIAYCLWFIFYYFNHGVLRPNLIGYAWIALALFCLDGLIMHTLSYQAILPGEWMNWYAPDGVLDMSGSKLHAIQWIRYLFIISLSAPIIGLFLIAYAQYFAIRDDFAPEYRQFAKDLGQTLTTVGFGIAAILFLGWQFNHSSATNLVLHPLGWLIFIALIGMVFAAQRFATKLHGYLPLVGGLGVLTLLAIWREIIRIEYLRPFGYFITEYSVNVDLPSIMLFFATLIGLGGTVGGFYLTLLYQAGQTQGHYTATKLVDKLGTFAIAILTLWIITFFTYGIVIWLANYFIV
ncbi:hypothetical protein TI05_09425 [Achromatium sp. WMS3]|nr:hypothetical protein TI05_09425 [Achromatium sp. WMS3]